MIESYAFGRMVIDGQEYRQDVIILPDGTVSHPWWRQSGHVLVADDLSLLTAVTPKRLVVGTGSAGMMSPDPELSADLASQGIRMIALPNEQAVREYNALLQKGEEAGACQSEGMLGRNGVRASLRVAPE